MMTPETRSFHPRVTVDLENHLIVVHGRPPYEIDLETFTDAASVLDWILQVSLKSWCDRALLGELAMAIETACIEWFDDTAQGVFCPGGESRQVDWLAKESVPVRQIARSKA